MSVATADWRAGGPMPPGVTQGFGQGFIGFPVPGMHFAIGAATPTACAWPVVANPTSVVEATAATKAVPTSRRTMRAVRGICFSSGCSPAAAIDWMYAH
jgi:hypothetical protein